MLSNFSLMHPSRPDYNDDRSLVNNIHFSINNSLHSDKYVNYSLFFSNTSNCNYVSNEIINLLKAQNKNNKLTFFGYKNTLTLLLKTISNSFTESNSIIIPDLNTINKDFISNNIILINYDRIY